MRTILAIAAATFLAGTQYAGAQVAPDPDIRGPLRRGAGAVGEALGAPGVENRVERRQARRGDLRTANDWRMRYYNNEWWYYTPQNSWMYYRDNRWMPYDQAAYQPLGPRYTTGYRGTYTGRVEDSQRDRFAYGRAGAPRLTIAIHDDGFEPQSIQVAPGTTVAWVNRGSHDHTVTSAEGTWDSGEIDPDGTYTARFKKPGTYHYVCDLHEGMQGTIVVADARGAEGRTADDIDVDFRRRRAPADADVDIDRPAADVDVDRRGADVDVNTPAADVEIDRDALPAPSQPAPQRESRPEAQPE